MIEILEAIKFAVWSYWSILTTGKYPSSHRR